MISMNQQPPGLVVALFVGSTIRVMHRYISIQTGFMTWRPAILSVTRCAHGSCSSSRTWQKFCLIQASGRQLLACNQVAPEYPISNGYTWSRARGEAFSRIHGDA